MWNKYYAYIVNTHMYTCIKYEYTYTVSITCQRRAPCMQANNLSNNNLGQMFLEEYSI